MTRQLGKQALLDAAAVLMDERGVDNVTVHDISQASGHRNRSAVQYHFGSRDAVIQAVISRNMAPIDAERNLLLDHMESTGATLTTRGVLEVVVRPLARQLRTPEGRRYFRIGAQLINHPRFMSDARDAITVNTSITRCAAYLLPSLDHLPMPIAVERTSQVTSFIVRACGDQSRLMDSDPPPRPVLSVEDFTVNLVDTIMAIVQAPTSVASPPAAARGLRRPVETARKGAPGHVLSGITYLWWFCRLRRENGPTLRYVVGVFALARELQPDDPQSIGPYRLVGQLGQGGMGRVFLGVSPGGRPVAVKAIRAELAANPEFRARFGREVSAARRVSGVFTAQVVDADVDGPVAWMATAYVPGPSLAEAVDTHGPLPEPSLLALAAGLAESLNAIHAVGVVHRDLKPSNVLLAEDGPRVIDFGISRAAESTMLTQAGLVVGSPGFMSPEQAMGSDVGPPSDIFNLGAVLAFAATGEGPFGTGTTAALLYRVVHGAPSLDLVPPTVRPLIEHCLAKDHRQRPTANGLLAEVGALQPGGTWLPESFTRTFPQGTPSRPGFAWSGPVAAAAAGAAAGAAVAGSNPALARTASAYAPPAAPPPAGPRTPAPGSWPYTGAGALTATAGSAPPTPPMGAYPPATPPPMPPPMPAGTGQPPRRRRMKPLVVALILGGIVGAGGAAAFAVTSFSGQPSTQLDQPAAQTSPATAPASVGPEVTSSTTVPSASPSVSSSAPYTSQPARTYSSPTVRHSTTPATSTTTPPTTPPTSPPTSPPTTPPTTPPTSASTSSSSSASTSASSPSSPPSSAPSS